MIAVLLFGILFVYSFFILLFVYGFYKVKIFQTNSTVTPITNFTIVVPFRDEAKNLPLLLDSISNLNYPKELFEVLLVDDKSAEKFEYSSSKFQLRIIDTLRTSNSPKKDAITTAISHVKTDWVITTDADCIIPENWLSTFDAFIQKNKSEMVAAPVKHTVKTSFLEHFQQLDFMSLQGATIGSFGIGKGFMCNGANFAYKKSFFKKLNGFEGNDKIASGDDVFLLQKAITISPEKVAYLKSRSAIVETQPTNSWKTLFFQRVRWAAKTSSYQCKFGKFIGLLVFITNLSFIVGLALLFFERLSFIHFALVVVLKFSVDFKMLFATNQFLENPRMQFWFWFWSSLLYPFFSSSVAFYSLFGKYEWKGRYFKI